MAEAGMPQVRYEVVTKAEWGGARRRRSSGRPRSGCRSS